MPSRWPSGPRREAPAAGSGGTMNGLPGKCVIVTGAASGIGLACVNRLLGEGARVVGADREDFPGSPTGGAGQAPDGGAWDFRRADVADEDSVTELVDAAVRFAGRVDGVVHAAGVAGGG